MIGSTNINVEIPGETHGFFTSMLVYPRVTPHFSQGFTSFQQPKAHLPIAQDALLQDTEDGPVR